MIRSSRSTFLAARYKRKQLTRFAIYPREAKLLPERPPVTPAQNPAEYAPAQR